MSGPDLSRTIVRLKEKLASGPKRAQDLTPAEKGVLPILERAGIITYRGNAWGLASSLDKPAFDVVTGSASRPAGAQLEQHLDAECTWCGEAFASPAGAVHAVCNGCLTREVASRASAKARGV